ncbi:N-6 DNA methylase [Salinibacter ruber]|uniref:N-6 DNA methylase n=1 Tax=Salinibacter ruber TaxID=146919 RepID=UPI00216913A7|nr:N-6 DNA methylase [Salinibacter ruber]MCS4198465.1 type I restriction enzyme M protein [Salinibacter ruber]
MPTLPFDDVEDEVRDSVVEIFRNAKHSLSIFSEDEVRSIIPRLTRTEYRGEMRTKIECRVRGREYVLKPEEIVRQIYLNRLIDRYKYDISRINVEHSVKFGSDTKKADIVIMDEDNPEAEYVVVELKRPDLLDGKDQLKSYCSATGSPIGVWTNGGKISHYHRIDPNHFEDIDDLPASDERLADLLRKSFTYADLVQKDKIPNEGKSLKDLIKEMEDEVLANAGVDVFEEVFKLIFTKLYDEYRSHDDKEYLERRIDRLTDDDTPSFEKVKNAVDEVDDSDFRDLEFHNYGETDSQLREKIQSLFQDAADEWSGIFSTTEEINLSPSHLSVCVSSLQNVKLFNSNLRIIDEAFEYLVNKSAKSDKGQYFTPRHVIDMCVKMLNPTRGESMIDTAAGSCGFTVHTIFYMTDQLFSTEDLSDVDRNAISKVFGIDFDEKKAVRVARTLNLIAGDGETNVLHLNTLDYGRWDEEVEDTNWQRTYGGGFDRLTRYHDDGSDYSRFNFDILMANPPFAGDIKESRILHKYDLAYKSGDEVADSVGREILFLERNIKFLKPGGRMAVVLPQGRFNNTTDQYIRDHIKSKGRILAVVSLHENTFKPHTGTKTSVLFFQKWNEDPDEGPVCPEVEDYPIFFAVSERGGKDNSGDYVYLEKEDGSPKVDKNGHLMIDHDLHNQDGELQDGIAEEFIEFAQEENLSFYP